MYICNYMKKYKYLIIGTLLCIISLIVFIVKNKINNNLIQKNNDQNEFFIQKIEKNDHINIKNKSNLYKGSSFYNVGAFRFEFKLTKINNEDGIIILYIYNQLGDFVLPNRTVLKCDNIEMRNIKNGVVVSNIIKKININKKYRISGLFYGKKINFEILFKEFSQGNI